MNRQVTHDLSQSKTMTITNNFSTKKVIFATSFIKHLELPSVQVRLVQVKFSAGISSKLRLKHVILFILFTISSFLDNYQVYSFINTNGSGALSGKMLLVRIIENNEFDDYFRADQVK